MPGGKAQRQKGGGSRGGHDPPEGQALAGTWGRRVGTVTISCWISPAHAGSVWSWSLRVTMEMPSSPTVGGLCKTTRDMLRSP